MLVKAGLTPLSSHSNTGQTLGKYWSKLVSHLRIISFKYWSKLVKAGLAPSNILIRHLDDRVGCWLLRQGAQLMSENSY
jgi:putative aminopeptidase FrvX